MYTYVYTYIYIYISTPIITYIYIDMYIHTYINIHQPFRVSRGFHGDDTALWLRRAFQARPTCQGNSAWSLT